MRRLMLAVGSVALVMVMTGSLGAAATADITVTCSISGAALSVEVSFEGSAYGPSTVVALGADVQGSWTVSGSSVSVRNNSGGMTESYKLNASSAIRGGDVWVLADAVGPDTFAIWAQFSGNSPAAWVVGNHALNYIPTYCTASKFTGSETGVSVPDTEVRGLWLQIGRPTSATDPLEHTTTVTVTAATPE